MTQAAIDRGAVARYRLAPGRPAEGGAAPESEADRAKGVPDLAYTVELWDEAKGAVEQVLAMTASGGIGFAAYYAATREYPARYVTLRHRNDIVSRWNGPGH